MARLADPLVYARRLWRVAVRVLSAVMVGGAAIGPRILPPPPPGPPEVTLQEDESAATEQR